jgi:hypothetical protein
MPVTYLDGDVLKCMHWITISAKAHDPVGGDKKPDLSFPVCLLINNCLTTTGLYGFMVPHLISTAIHYS